MNSQQIEAVKMLGQAFVDTVRDQQRLGEPCPEGPMYMAYMQAGGDIGGFTNMIEALVKVGRLKRVGAHCLALGPQEKL